MTNWKYGERLFRQTMQQRGYKVVNVADNPAYYDKDIDVILTSPTTGITKSFEVKWDGNINHTGNLYLEIKNERSKQWNGEGWWKHIQADVLAYGDARAHKFYMIDVEELKERVPQLPQITKTCDNGTSEGIIVSLDQIKDLWVEL